MLGRLASLARLFGMDGGQGVATLLALPRFLHDYHAFRSRLGKCGDHPFVMGKMYPCLVDDKENSGTASGAYFHQDLLVANRVFCNVPKRHVDVGSRIDGFVAHVACFRQIEVFDIRPLESKISSLIFRQVDMMKELPADFVGCSDSVSCLHALEHFGLGRYGDPIDPFGYLAGFRNLTALLSRGGTLYLSVPIGRQRVEFNAHRVFSVAYLLRLFKADYELIELSYVDDAGDLSRNVAPTPEEAESSFGCDYGCGIFELRKH